MSGAAPVRERKKVLFLCTGNSARSILAEFLLRRMAGDRFDVFSAGSHPKGEVHPMALKVLRQVYKINTKIARSKSVSEFKDMHFDFVITVCDHARESCPVWPGQPIVAHWGMSDPAASEATGPALFEVFWQTAIVIKRRLELFCSLPMEKLDRLQLEQATGGIGHQAG